MSYWSKLSMKDKADVMRLFLDKGISDLDTMRREYNTFAEGGDTNDADLVDWIIREEGFNSKPENIGDGKITLGSGLTDPKWHALYKKRGNKWSEADNRMAVAEEVANRRKWAEKNIPNWDTLPDSAQKALLSYKYNYNFTSANSPKLFQALADSNLYEAAKQMDATSKDPKFKKGLMDRRKREQEWFLSDVAGNATPTQAIPVQAPTTIGISMPSIIEPAVSTAVRNNYVPATTTPYNRGNNMRRGFESAVAYNRMMDATSLQNNPLPEYPFPISYADGGKIHIDPSKKGTFTAAASRHGMGVQEFASKVLANKENYSPAMVKKANFARNASKWHGLGGNLFSGEENHSQQMITTGGAGYVPPISISAVEDVVSEASKKIMNYIKGAHDTGSYFSYDSSMEPYTGPAQDTYLLPRKLQEKEFLKRGYIKGKNKDYGLVKKAVGSRNLPVYQRNPDVVSRNGLTVIGNVHGWDPWYGDSNTSLEHAGSYPTALYTDGEGNFYQKGWDLNDYGGKTGSTTGFISDIVDRIGSPVVVTTGYQPVKDPQNERFIQEITPMMAKKGLVPTEINGKTEWTLPEITVVEKRKKKHGLGGLLEI